MVLLVYSEVYVKLRAVKRGVDDELSGTRQWQRMALLLHNFTFGFAFLKRSACTCRNTSLADLVLASKARER